MTQQAIPQLIGSLEAARRLRMHRATFNKLVQEGQVPIAAEIPGRTGARLFDPAVIEDLARAQVNA